MTPKALDPEELAELAIRKLNLGRTKWRIVCYPFHQHISVRVIHAVTGMESDTTARFSARSDVEGQFLEAVRAAVADLNRRLASPE